MTYEKTGEPRGNKPRVSDDAVLTLYRQGHTLQEIGDVCGFTRERARQILAKHNLRSSATRRVFTDEIRDQVYYEYLNSDRQFGEILKEHGFSVCNLRLSIPKDLYLARRARQYWEKVDIKGEKECWPWRGGLGAQGYGRAVILGKTHPAHSVAWFLTHHEWPQTKMLLHSCKNNVCCNPNHLLPSNDPTIFRSPNYRTRFTPEQAAQIREEYKTLSQPKLAIKYNCAEITISAVINHRGAYRDK